MAMELWILSDKKLGSITEWQAAINAEETALVLSDERPLDKSPRLSAGAASRAANRVRVQSLARCRVHTGYAKCRF